MTFEVKLLCRYGINARQVAHIMQNYIEKANTEHAKKNDVTVFCIFIGSLGDQAERLRSQLPAGRAYIAHTTDEIPNVMQQIFSVTLNV